MRFCQLFFINAYYFRYVTTIPESPLFYADAHFTDVRICYFDFAYSISSHLCYNIKIYTHLLSAKMNAGTYYIF